jgi:hypothetical protein
MSDPTTAAPLPEQDHVPFRKTTNLAVDAVMANMHRALTDVAKAAIEDGEVPEGYVFDIDRRIWRKPQ